MLYPMEYLNNVERKISNYIYQAFNEALPEDFGLDRRSAFRIYVSKGFDCIAVAKRDDRDLQYYGGFEYVDADARKEMGDWVFYFSDDERVLDHIHHYMDHNQQAEEA